MQALFNAQPSAHENVAQISVFNALRSMTNNVETLSNSVGAFHVSICPIARRVRVLQRTNRRVEVIRKHIGHWVSEGTDAI